MPYSSPAADAGRPAFRLTRTHLGLLAALLALVAGGWIGYENRAWIRVWVQAGKFRFLHLTEYRDRQVVVCLFPAAHNEGDARLWGEARLTGCFSSSCTRLESGSVEAEVDAAAHVLYLHTTLVVWHAPPETMCTADCGGGHEPVSFSYAMPDAGIYTVQVGEETLGRLELPPNSEWCQGVPGGTP